jgi:hypothetical protein
MAPLTAGSPSMLAEIGGDEEIGVGLHGGRVHELDCDLVVRREDLAGGVDVV